MAGIDKIRQSFPEYSALSDGELAFSIWNEFYKGKIPLGEFASRAGIDQGSFAGMVDAAKKSGYEPTSRSISTDYIPEGMKARALLGGMTMGAGDEIVAGGAALVDTLAGQNPQMSLADKYRNYQMQEQGKIDAARQNAPGTAYGLEIGGSLLTPLGAAKTYKQALGLGAAYGGTTGYLSARPGERLQGGAEGALLGALMTPALKFGFDKVAAGFARVLDRKARAAAAMGAPAIDALRKEADDAYAAARASGAVVNAADYEKLVSDIIAQATQKGMDPDLTPAAATAARRLQEKVGQNVGIDELSLLREKAAIPMGKMTEPKEQMLGSGMVGSIDDFIEGLTPQQLSSGTADNVGEQFANARELWGRMRRSEAMQTAIDYASTYKSGFENGLKQYISTMLRNPKKMRGFNEAEVKLMKEIVNGTPLGNAVSQVGKMGLAVSGGSSGLGAMTGMGLGSSIGAAIGSAMGIGPAGGAIGAGVGAATALAGGTMARRISEMSLEGRAKLLQALVASGRARQLIETDPAAFQMLAEAAQRLSQGMVTGSQAQRNAPEGRR